LGRGVGCGWIVDGPVGDDELVPLQAASPIAMTTGRNLVDVLKTIALSLLSRKRQNAVRT
jgi:hypothetical protein